MKKNVLRILFVLAVFVCGYVSEVLINDHGKAEAGYGSIYYQSATCVNSGGATDEVYVEIKFSRAMTYLRMASTIDGKTWKPFFMPQ